MSRSASAEPPRGARAHLHFLSDTHYGATSATRLDKVKRDIAEGAVPTPNYRFFGGDFINEQSTTNLDAARDTGMVAWCNSLADKDGVVPSWRTIVGNHDIYDNLRTGTAAMTAFGMPSLNWAVNVSADIRVIGISPETVPVAPNIGRMVYRTSAAPNNALSFLDAELAAADRDCLILAHAPLADTVIDPIMDTAVSNMYDSKTSRTAPGVVTVDFRAYGPNNTNDSEIRTILNNRPRARMWVSGHTHNHPYYANCIGTTSVGTRSVTFVSIPAVYFVAPLSQEYDPLWGFYLTVTRDGSWEARLRNHGAGHWDAWNGAPTLTAKRVWTVA